MKKYYQIAGHTLSLCGENLCKAVDAIQGFKPFAIEERKTDFSIKEGKEVPGFGSIQYSFSNEGVRGEFGRNDKGGFLLALTPEEDAPLYIWSDVGGKEAHVCGNYELRLIRFALWVGYGMMVLPYETVAIHTSCIVYKDQAVLFLGESGTGKSTHTRLWREHVEGSFLLNDDSPIIRVEDGVVWVYGSPWSGKTPCYKAQRHQLKGCVRLSQAPHNKIRKLSILQAYGAIHPSCPPEFAYDNALYDHVSRFISELLRRTPLYHMECLPDREAALLSSSTLFPDIE